MLESEVIIIGGGPAGSACAWKLKQEGVQTIILDKKKFPRHKTCAGWITPRVFSTIGLKPEEYPFGISFFRRLNFHFFGIPLPVITRQYSVRRYEFDHWLMDRSGVPVEYHEADDIRKENGYYIIDNKFRCRYLIGAGGTYCRVYGTFFKKANPRSRKLLITAMEDEFEYDCPDKKCYLWFFEKGLPGYSWYVPKDKRYLNIGIGGKLGALKDRGKTILDHWNLFIKKLEDRSLVDKKTFKPRALNYYLRQNINTVHMDNAFIIGDAAGLATLDMGEGIGPAIESGLLAAISIINGTEYRVDGISRYSFLNILFSHWNK